MIHWKPVRQGGGWAFRILPLVLFTSLAGATPQDPPAYRISVDVNLVVLHATVRDHSGGFASDLHETDFQVYENGVPQAIRLFRHEDLPVTVGLVVDHSGSMRRKLGEVTAATRSFVRSSNPQDQMFVVNFNEKVTQGLPAAVSFSNRADELGRAIAMTPAEGMTALYDALSEAMDRLRTGSGDQRVLIAISDGGDNASVKKLAEVLHQARESNAMLYTIGVFDPDDRDGNPGVLRRLARESGGEAFFPGERNEVVAVCEGIARDIRHQYTIGYVPSEAVAPGAYRAIRVEAKAAGRGKLVVRARTGYIAGAP